jgi:hypothetical protein
MCRKVRGYKSIQFGKRSKLCLAFDLQQHLDVSSFPAANSFENPRIAASTKVMGAV